MTTTGTQDKHHSTNQPISRCRITNQLLPGCHTPGGDCPLPAGAEGDGEWILDDPHVPAWRLLRGRTRSVGDTIVHYGGFTTGLAEVETGGSQNDDGTFDPQDPPHILVHVYTDTGLDSDQAREVAALLIEAADEIDGWVTR
jgi:hypothetical protein